MFSLSKFCVNDRLSYIKARFLKISLDVFYGLFGNLNYNGTRTIMGQRLIICLDR